jgi:hypothetical protein
MYTEKKFKRVLAMAKEFQFETITNENHLILYYELRREQYITCDFTPDGLVIIDDPYGEEGEKLDRFRYDGAKKAIGRFCEAIVKCLN